MRAVPRQIDQFVKDASIKQDEACHMCDMLHIDIERQRGETAHRETLICWLVKLFSAQHKIINMWRLATVAAVIWALLMTWASIRGHA